MTGSRLLVWAMLGLWLMSAGAQQGGFANGERLFNAGDYEAAERVLQEAVAAGETTPEAFYLLGLAAIQNGNDETAIAALRNAARLAPGLPGVHLNMGIAYHRLRLYGFAERELMTALERDPDDETARFFLGLNSKAQGQDEAAIRALSSVSGEEPGLRQVARYQAGLIYRQQGENELARQALAEAVRLDPGSETGKLAAAELRALEGGLGRPGDWSFSISGGLQYDDNVTSDEQDITTNEGDNALVADFSGAYTTRLRDTEIEAGYDFATVRYDTLDEFDLYYNGFYVSGYREMAGMDVGLDYRFSYTYLDDEEFTAVHGLRPSVGFGLGTAAYGVLAINLQDENFFTDPARDAIRRTMGGDIYLAMAAGARASAGYFREYEDARGPEFDYTAHNYRVAYSRPLSLFARRARVGIGARYYQRDYLHVTPSIGEERRDERTTVNLGLDYPLDERLFLNLDYEYIDANSNLPSADLTENVVTGAVSYSW